MFCSQSEATAAPPPGAAVCRVQSSISIWSHHTINLLVDQEPLSLSHSLQCARLPLLMGEGGRLHRANVKSGCRASQACSRENKNFDVDCCISVAINLKKKCKSQINTDLLYYGAKCNFPFQRWIIYFREKNPQCAL